MHRLGLGMRQPGRGVKPRAGAWEESTAGILKLGQPGCSGDRISMLDGSRVTWGRSRGRLGPANISKYPLTGSYFLYRIVFLIFKGGGGFRPIISF